jgi:anti-anti-sigma regulatory factor
MKLNRNLIQILLPALLTVILFFVVIFRVMIPILENSIIEKKREMTHELTETAWSVLVYYHKLEQEGILSREEAQAHAAAHIRDMRYGPEGKDYFWINDMRPYMIMHPYQPDLEGKDISDFADPNGKHLFLAFVETARTSGEGYVDYMWQWKDDSQRIVPKVSYIKLFEPWDWIIGTGIYIEDVRAEISELTNRAIVLSIGILVIIAILLSFTITRSFRIERKRREAEAALQASNRELEDQTIELEQEILIRKHAEEERTRQLQILEAQQETIHELSTPVIPVMEAPDGSGSIIVLPLIGSIDSMRAKDITRSLLAGISQHRAKVVILDVTGVGIMDTGIVNHLNKTIQAARLKGTRTIVTGISDAVAEAIVELGIDWSDIETLRNLQTGLVVALKSLGIKLSQT